MFVRYHCNNILKETNDVEDVSIISLLFYKIEKFKNEIMFIDTDV